MLQLFPNFIFVCVWELYSYLNLHIVGYNLYGPIKLYCLSQMLSYIWFNIYYEIAQSHYLYIQNELKSYVRCLQWEMRHHFTSKSSKKVYHCQIAWSQPIKFYIRFRNYFFNTTFPTFSIMYYIVYHSIVFSLQAILI